MGCGLSLITQETENRCRIRIVSTYVKSKRGGIEGVDLKTRINIVNKHD